MSLVIWLVIGMVSTFFLYIVYRLDTGTDQPDATTVGEFTMMWFFGTLGGPLTTALTAIVVAVVLARNWNRPIG